MSVAIPSSDKVYVGNGDMYSYAQLCRGNIASL